MITFLIENRSQDSQDLSYTLTNIESLISQIPGSAYRILSEDDCLHFASVLKELSTDYVLFLRSGDNLSFAGLDIIPIMASKHYELISTRCIVSGKSYGAPPFPPAEIDLEEMLQYTPASHYSCFIRKDVLQNCQSVSDASVLYQIYSSIQKNSRIYFATSIVHFSCEFPYSRPSGTGNNSVSWYMDLCNELLLPISKDCDSTSCALSKPLQYVLPFLIWIRFKQNMNNGNKHVIDNEYPEFISAIKVFLSHVDDAILLRRTEINFEKKHMINTQHSSRYLLPFHFSVSMLQLKYGENFCLSYDIVKENDKKNIYVKLKDVLFFDLSNLKCNIDLIEYDERNELFTIDFHIDNFVDLSQFELHFFINEQPLEVFETYYYAHTKYFGVSVQKPITYRSVFSVPKNLSKCKQKKLLLRWEISYRDVALPLSVKASHYCARINTSVPKCYWKFSDNILSISKGDASLRIVPAKHRVLLYEIIFFAKNFRLHKATRVFGVRAAYWITRPWMKKKTIWLTYDKLYKGGDCGEYLYKYACTRQQDTGITPAYVINGDSADYKRLVDEGYHPLKYKSLKHLIYYLNSSVVFTTHGGVYNFNGFTNASVKYIQGLLHHDVACIQHGLSVQQLAHNSHRLFNNMKRYYCASKYEIENLSRPIYGYEDKSMLQLTGIPRYDGLINNDKHQILITPTWRNYIALPAGAKNEAKPYFEGFKDTDYFKIYNRLLSDERLIATARKTGYRLIYLLHPVISAQIDDYPKNEFVEIIPSLTVNYEKILTESSLMVTDYSGVQFDFAYMRKPVIYYHPDELPPHYKEGGFFYDTMGFGEICKKHEEIVSLLCDYMETGCQLKDFYEKREDDFFAYRDLNSCERIYNDMLSFQKKLYIMVS